MNRHWLACAAVLSSSTPALAIDWDVGIEGAGSLTLPNGSTSWGTATSGAGGIIVEERLSLAMVELSLWEDVQTPYSQKFLGDEGGASYAPIDVGLRVGLAFSVLHPYVGILGNYNVDSSSNAVGAESFWGLGGDLGLDIVVLFLRFGIELRAFGSVTKAALEVNSLGPAVPESTVVLQGLLSARVSF